MKLVYNHRDTKYTEIKFWNRVDRTQRLCGEKKVRNNISRDYFGPTIIEVWKPLPQ